LVVRNCTVTLTAMGAALQSCTFFADFMGTRVRRLHGVLVKFLLDLKKLTRFMAVRREREEEWH
jgi:hypothetical protein